MVVQWKPIDHELSVNFCNFISNIIMLIKTITRGNQILKHGQDYIISVLVDLILMQDYWRQSVAMVWKCANDAAMISDLENLKFVIDIVFSELNQQSYVSSSLNHTRINNNDAMISNLVNLEFCKLNVLSKSTKLCQRLADCWIQRLQIKTSGHYLSS